MIFFFIFSRTIIHQLETHKNALKKSWESEEEDDGDEPANFKHQQNTTSSRLNLLKLD